MKKILSICCLLMGLSVVNYAQTGHTTTTDPVEKAKGLQKQLKLSDDQTTKIAVIYKESAQKFEKIKVAENGNTNKMAEAIKPLRAATIKKIKGILTPTQAVKYDKLIKDTGTAAGKGWGDGWSATSN